MKVVFRTDSSSLIGTGHLMRCLTLAGEFRESGHDCRFVCRDLPGNVSRLVEDRGFALARLTGARHPAGDKSYDAWLAVAADQDAAETKSAFAGSIDWLVVDHYGIDHYWESKIRSEVGKVLVVDDLANRRHECDVITEQNYRAEGAKRYTDLVPEGCQQLVGPEYALIRPEFAELRRTTEPRKVANRLLVFYGGVDATNETEKALNSICGLQFVFEHIDVVIGEANTNRSSIESLAKTVKNASVHCPAKDMSELMVSADLALGAGGVTSWERCTLGLPTIITAVAENQIEIGEGIAGQAAGWHAGVADDVTVESLQYLLEEVLLGRRGLMEASENAMSLCDGLGAHRVAEQLVTHGKTRQVAS